MAAGEGDAGEGGALGEGGGLVRSFVSVTDQHRFGFFSRRTLRGSVGESCVLSGGGKSQSLQEVRPGSPFHDQLLHVGAGASVAPRGHALAGVARNGSDGGGGLAEENDRTDGLGSEEESEA